MWKRFIKWRAKRQLTGDIAWQFRQLNRRVEHLEEEKRRMQHDLGQAIWEAAEPGNELHGLIKEAQSSTRHAQFDLDRLRAEVERLDNMVQTTTLVAQRALAAAEGPTATVAKS